MDLSPYTDFVRLLAQASGQVIKPLFGRADIVVDLKDDQSPVTEADQKAEAVMRRLIEENFPQHGIMGEEYGSVATEAEYVWVLDPIDGTKSFTAGCPLFGTLIALLHKGVPLLGAINIPILDQLLIGDNRHTECNGVTVKMRPCESLQQALILSTDPETPAKYQCGPGWNDLLSKVKGFRTWGDCFGYYLAASGRADIACDPVMNPWDLLALIPVIRGAGGAITDWQGKDPVKGNSIVAAHPSIHEDVIRTLNP